MSDKKSSNFSISDDNIEAILRQHKLSSEDYIKITQMLNRQPNLIEIGIFSAMWSEHCSYKSSKIYLKEFPTKAPWVLQGPGENAGVIDLGENTNNERLVAIFKIESHNHPSFIEPNAGAATGVGGILRDIFTMGANPIANLNVLRFGDILDSSMKKKHTHLLHGVVDGIGHYGNCMGIPTIGGETGFESCYNGNILVNAFSLGIAKQNEVFYGKAIGIGNPIVYVGSKTGRDGLGGAIMSSNSFDSQTKALRPTVQIGDPFTEKLLLDACLEVFKNDLIVGIQDMGAAGLTSSSFEMASRSKSGMILWLERVPMRESGMSPYELMLSESQERMLICAKKGCEDRIKEIFAKYELDCVVIGEVTDSGKMELFWHGNICASLMVDQVVESSTILKRPISKPKYLKYCKELQLSLDYKNFKPYHNYYKKDEDFNSYNNGANYSKEHTLDLIYSNMDKELANIVFREMLSSLDINDKSWIYNQYDQSIKASTIKAAGLGDASIVSLKNFSSPKAISMSAKCDSRYCYLDPRGGAKIAVAKSGRNVALSGAKPLAITNCLNFGNPENPEVMWQFKESCNGIKEACITLNTPVVSGNVSLYNQTNENDIYPTPSIVSVGLLEDYSYAIGSHFVKEDSLICLIGGNIESALINGDNMGIKVVECGLDANRCMKSNINDSNSKESNKTIKHKYNNNASYFAGSLLQKILNNPPSGEIVEIDLDIELRLWEFLQECTQIRLLLSAKDIGSGGIAITLAKMATIGNKGLQALLPFESICTVDYRRITKLYGKQIANMLTRLYTNYNDNEFNALIDSGKQTALQYVLSLTGNNKILIHEILRDFLKFNNLTNTSLFAETHSQIVCEIFPHNLGIIKHLANSKGLECYCIGKVGTQSIQISNIVIPLNEARDLYYNSFEKKIFG
ncbi:phosphoribosylformylglycinamidine synthase subunit PurL [Helicobacter muridarum]|uniref:Phosphoribosylformylglycinamidine synthase subunit PurL n=1 Tax=Helicobacter muridarum TaxID=216 RepID=A0A377PVQ2_9HELI|nr:phosphoribosylformylglycinamidine synthase subunit PurL [Helicobacter muridarum]TLE00733.1 phosphoribosylformylglycinamidine synthase subunit PurL [Helicobacter muridarum]STQ86590.1 phosphoribosylformylglycinamidine synthase II [Helicobacter muridarum]